MLPVKISLKYLRVFQSICYFLDQQSQYFVDTADRLVQLAREELVFARLLHCQCMNLRKAFLQNRDIRKFTICCFKFSIHKLEFF